MKENLTFTRDNHDPFTKLLFDVLGIFAEFERNLISERTAMALAHKRSQHQVYNHTPYGYQRQGERMVEVPEEQRIIRSIKKWREKGESYRGIADRLNGGDIPTKQGGYWHPSTIRQILGNDLHKGSH